MIMTKEILELPLKVESGDDAELKRAYHLGGTAVAVSDGSWDIYYPDDRLKVCELRASLLIDLTDDQLPIETVS